MDPKGEDMLKILDDAKRAEPLFRGWEETMITSCLQGLMGRILVADGETANDEAADGETPRSACACLGCFSFYAGEPCRELLMRPELQGQQAESFGVLVPQTEAWATLIEETVPGCRRVVRYAMKKDTRFDAAKLWTLRNRLPAGYELRPLDGQLYDRCLEHPSTADFVSAFSDKEQYLRYGRGMVIVKDGAIVSGASSFSRYREGIEIEVDTVEPERRKHLATAACAALILRCLDEGLYPSWDAQNLNSVALAQSLGYELDHEYTAYEVGKIF